MVWRRDRKKVFGVSSLLGLPVKSVRDRDSSVTGQSRICRPLLLDRNHDKSDWSSPSSGRTLQLVIQIEVKEDEVKFNPFSLFFISE